MRANLIASSVAALALASGGASAQTVISRSISAQPVETIVTETPTGTIVTRRPVQGQIVQPAIAPPIMAPVAPAVPQATVVESDTVDTVTTGTAVRRAQAAPPPAMTTRQVSQTTRRAASQHQSTRKTTHTTRTTTTGAVPRLALDPRERHIVYQTIVEREVVPRQRVIVAPTYVQPRIAAAPQPPIVAADDVEVVPPAGPITVGTVLPANVPLYAIPENVALSVPATQTYSYAYLGGRAYLVEPSSGTVVADVTD